MIAAEESDIGVRHGGTARAKKGGREDRKKRKGHGKGSDSYEREWMRERKRR